MQRIKFRPSVAHVVLLTALCCGPLFGQAYDQKIPVNACQITQDSICFPLVNGASYSVSKETNALSDSFNFCVETNTIPGAKAARFILTIDRSASMCFDMTNCPGSARNDPNNVRITAALALIDSLKVKNPASQVGIVTFSTAGSANTIGPMALTDANVVTLKSFVNNNSGKCSGALGKSQAQNASFTCIGEAVKKAIQLADSNYASVHDTMERQVVLMTDGSWSDSLTSSPKLIMAGYHTSNPGRVIPPVHTLFLFDSSWHVQNGNPALGLDNCNPNIPVTTADLRFLGEISDSTHGRKIPPSSPQSIVANLLQLVESIVVLYPGLQNVWMYNLTYAGTQSFGTTTLIQQLPTSSIYKVKLNQPLSLFPGSNSIRIIESLIKNGVIDLDTFSITINRTNTAIAGSIDLGPLKQTCGIDTVRMEVSANPTSVMSGNPVTVSAQIYPSDINKFSADSIIIRAITSNTVDANTIALFHLDSNLTGLGASGNGTGTPSYAAGVFGRGLAAGSQFAVTLSTPPADDFLIDAWVKIVVDNQELVICSGIGMLFKININRHLVFQGSSALGTLTSNWRIDKNVWVHVAVARSSDKITLFANGIPVSAQPSTSNSTGTLPATITVGPCTAGYLDEVQVSSVNRIVSIGSIQTISLPKATMTWHVGTVSTTADTAELPAHVWNLTSGNVSFTATNPVTSNIIFNLFNARPYNASAIWSKNSPSVHSEGNSPIKFNQFNHYKRPPLSCQLLNGRMLLIIDLVEKARVSLDIYNLAGKNISNNLHNIVLNEGTYTYAFSDLGISGKGAYICRLNAGGKLISRFIVVQ